MSAGQGTHFSSGTMGTSGRIRIIMILPAGGSAKNSGFLIRCHESSRGLKKLNE